MIHDPTRHEPLTSTAWSPDAARAFVERLLADAEAAFDRTSLWPRHPLDHDQESPTTSAKCLYDGAAGMIWATAHLQGRGYGQGRVTAATYVDDLVAAHRLAPDAAGAPGLLVGELGVALVASLVRGSPADLEGARAAAAATIPLKELELLWAAPGAVYAAVLLAGATRDERFRALAVQGAEHLLATWQEHEGLGCRLWLQDLYGRRQFFLGFAHGFAGCAGALLAALPLLPPVRQAEILEHVGRTLRRTAVVDEAAGTANWKVVADGPEQKRLLQWCHGAPGVVTGLWRYPTGVDPDVDGVLQRGAELTWQAGPLALTKPHGLCHGTAGNGYAFLAQYRRTGDAVWLDRARSFAMHAIEQAEAARAKYGRWRYSLHCGDVGAAVYVADALEGTWRGWPSLE